jgi:hypothetical protein
MPSFQRVIPKNYVTMEQVGSDVNFIFASPSTPVNTQKTTTITRPADPVECYDVHIYNPSTESDLTLKLFEVVTPWSGAGGQANSYIDTLTIPKYQAVSGTTITAHKNQVYGLFNGYDCKFVMSNNTALATGVTPVMRIMEYR